MTTMNPNQLDPETAARIEQILEEIGQYALDRGWRREDVAVAMAMGAGDLCAHCSDPAELDRSVGAVISLIHHRAGLGLRSDAGKRH